MFNNTSQITEIKIFEEQFIKSCYIRGKSVWTVYLLITPSTNYFKVEYAVKKGANRYSNEYEHTIFDNINSVNAFLMDYNGGRL